MPGEKAGDIAREEAGESDPATRELTSDSDEQLRAMLTDARTIAVVGMKDAESEDAFRVPRYMQEHGHRILPVNPKLSRALGERAVGSLHEIEEPVDLVNLFRAANHIPAHVDEILSMHPLPKTVWMQLGIVHGSASARLRSAGIQVVQDRCIMVDHRRLIG
jgi:hypothetical protein